MFQEIFDKAALLKTGKMTLAEFLAIEPIDRAAICGCVAGQLSGRDPAAAYGILSGAMLESEGQL